MASYSTELKVGVFTIAAMVVMAFMFLFLNPKSLDRSSYNEYYTIIDDASGIIPRSQIKTSGVVIGEVAGVTLSNNRTKITFSIDSKVTIAVGSKVEVRTRGLLGDVFIEIIRSADKGKHIPNGGLIPKSEDSIDMQKLVSLFGSIAKDVKNITSSLAGSMEDGSGNSNMKDIISNIKDITGGLKEVVGENKSTISTIIGSIQSTTDAFGRAFGNSSTDIKDILASVKESSRNFSELTQQLKSIASKENSASISNSIAKLNDAMSQFQKSANVMGTVMAKVEGGEGTIGKLLNDDTTITEVEGALKDIRQALNPVNKLKVKVDYRGEMSLSNANRNYLNLNLYTKKDKFYVLGVTDGSQLSASSRTTKTATSTSGEITTTTEDESFEDKPRMTFNAQFGKRWGPAGLRFGLFESKGGFGADFYMFEDALKVSVEAFDWKTAANSERKAAHIKSYASVHFLKYLYAVAGVDDVTRYKPNTTELDEPDYYFGAGLSFNDEDLRSILGLATLAR